MAGLSGEVANLIVALKLDDSGFTGRLNKAAGQLRAMDSGLSQMGRGMGQVGTGFIRLGERAALAAAGGLTAVVTTAASYEQAFTGVEKTVDATEAQFAELAETLKRMAGSTGTSFEELAAIGEAGGALGIAREDLDEFIDIVNRLGVSTNLSTDQAATALGQLANILDLSGTEMRDLSDMLVALGNAGASTEDQIVDMAARFAAAGNSAGLSNQEILALSSSVASMGIEVEAGGSSLSRLFNNTTTNIGVANDKAQAFADALGLTFDQFKKSWDEDALGTFGDLLEHLNTLDQFEGAALLQDIGITNTRDINAIMLMAQNVDFLGDQLDIAADAQGALNEESDKFFGTTAANWDKVKQNARNVFDTIGQQLLPIVNEQMQEFVDWLNQASTQRDIKQFAEDLADGVGGLISDLKGTDFSGIVGGLKLAAEVAKGAFDAFRSLPEPIQQLAVAALVANRVTGGAIGMIAKGFANIFGGALKTIYASHVTVIGGTGGVPGVPGGGGGGGAGLLTRFLALAGVAAGGAVIGAHIGTALNEGTVAPARDFAQSRIKAVLESGDADRIQQAIRAVKDGLEPDNVAQGIALGLDVNGVRTTLETELAALQAAQRDTWVATGRAEAAIRDATPWSQRTADTVSRIQSEAATSDANMIALAQRASDYGARTAVASETTAGKDYNPEINLHNTFAPRISVSATVIQNQIYKQNLTAMGSLRSDSSGPAVR